MGLLDKIKAGAADKAAAAGVAPAGEKVNPFGPKTGAAKPTAPAEKVAPATPAVGAKVNPLAGAKANPLTAAPKANPLSKPAEATAPVEKKNPLGNPLAKANTAPVEKKETEETTLTETTPVEEQNIVEAIKEDDKKAPVAEVKAETPETELKAEEKKAPATGKGSRGGKGKTTVSAAAPVEKKTEALACSDDFVIPTTAISFDEALEAIKSPFVDERWAEFRTSIEDQLEEIVIENDMNPGSMKVTISRLSQIRQAIATPYQEMKTRFEDLVNKEPEGLIERVKKLNISGTNDLERKRTGIRACMSYMPPSGEGPMNLYEVLSEVRERYNFLKISMDSVQYKTNILITMSSALKLENSHLPGEQ